MYIPPIGPRNARIAIVGEKPGADELRKGEPFVGASGIQLNDLLTKVGLNRNQVYITNAVKQVQNVGNPTQAEIAAELPQLYKELTALPNLNVIIPMGASALQALSNFQLKSIASYRGSILPTFFQRKMVPTFHPAFFMRGEWRFKPVVKFDLSRALEESYAPTINVPQRRCYIAQQLSDLEYIAERFAKSEYCSFDIELFRGRYIQCIAFSREPDEAYCIPLATGNRKSIFKPEVELKAWQVIQQILSQEHSTYVTQNGLFDCWHLWRHGITTPFMHKGLDTMLMHRLRAPDLPHDLGFLVSIYTREPYYKDESGAWDTQDRSVDDNTFFAYNCKDASCTLEVCFALVEDLKRSGQLENFKTEVQAQWLAVTRMRQVGIKVDQLALRAAREALQREIAAEEEKIKTALGYVPNTKSSNDMERVYNELGIRFQRTPSGKAKTDIEQLYNHAYNNPQQREVLYSIAGLNGKRTLYSGFTNFPVDRDGYYHPSLDISKTKTGRLASKGADEGGPQIQNITKRLRHIFVPDGPDSEITNADLSGAEGALIAWFSQDRLMIEAFIRRLKTHRVIGCQIYRNWNKPELPPKELLDSIRIVCDDCAKLGQKECGHSEYAMSKQSRYAMSYREGPRRFCHEQRKKGIFISESVAKDLRSKIITPALHQWHLGVEASLRRTPWLSTPLGRKREFYGQFDDTLINQALSWLCQTTIGQITNRAMIWLDAEIAKNNYPCRILTQTHDSLTLSNAKTFHVQTRALLSQAFNQPMKINDRELLIPIEITHGPNWRDLA